MDAFEEPDIIPCYNGQEVNIDKVLVNACLTAISFKQIPEVNEITKNLDDANLFTHRNSFINLHRPEMTKVPAAPKSPHKLKQYFRDQAIKFGITCPSAADPEGFNSEQPQETDQIRWLLQARDSFSSNTDGTLSTSATNERIENCSIPLTDEDLSPGEFPRKSRAQFCVLMRGFNNLSQETTDLMHEAADRLVEGSMDTKTISSNAPKKHVVNESAMSSPGSLYCNAEPTPDYLHGTNPSVNAKSCLTTQELNKAK